MNENFFDLLDRFIKKTSDENQINEELYDLATEEGYGNYMKFLGELRVRAEKYNDIFKLLLGEDVGTVIDQIAQKATDVYEKAKKEKAEAEEKQRIEQEKKAKVENASKECKQCTCSKEKIDIANEHQCSNFQTKKSLPSDNVNDNEYEKLCNLVNEYVDLVLPEKEGNEWIESELIEFACWLYKK